MIFGIGTDIIEVERIKQQLKKINGLNEKIYTEKEKRYCESKKYSAQHYAGRYAAKEAFFKALGTGWRYGFKFNEIELVNDELGRPKIMIYGKIKEFIIKKNIKNIHVSISHLKDIANAFVILEY